MVGENGAGKTTLVKLLARLYDPTEGRILLDGHDLREYDLAESAPAGRCDLPGFPALPDVRVTKHCCGKYFREGKCGADHCFCSSSLADAVVQRLPGKYDQPLGKRFNQGVELSGGEWQKIALARAYMKDAQLLILDEPTAALDARAEYEVFQRFSELTMGKTAVLISHRFSTVRMADQNLGTGSRTVTGIRKP